MPGFTVAHVRADDRGRLPRRNAPPRDPRFHPSTPPPAAAAVPWAGRIRFLPPKHEITVDCSSVDLDEEGYGHPVVILSSSIPQDRQVVVLTVTSQEPRSNTRWTSYLPIHPSRPHPTLGGLVLHLAPGCEPFEKNSYVNISRRVVIPLEATRPYYGQDGMALSPDSFKVLAENMKCRYATTTATPAAPAVAIPALAPSPTLPPTAGSRTRPPAAAAMAEARAVNNYASMLAGQRTPRPASHYDRRYCPSSLPDAYPADSNTRSNERTSLRSSNAGWPGYDTIPRPATQPVWPPPAGPRGPSIWARLGRMLLRAAEGVGMWFWWRKQYILAWVVLMLVFFGTGWCVVKGCQLVKAGWDWVAAGVSGAAEGLLRWAKGVLGLRA